jgi:hypothetical protein
MSELVNARKTKTNFRLQLLATASAIALVCTYETGEARAADDDASRSSVWIELGGQLSRLYEGQEIYAPDFMAVRPATFLPSQGFEGLPLSSFDETGKISFEPNGSGWVLSASVLYGRSSSHKHSHEQTHPGSFIITRSGAPISGVPPQTAIAARFADTLVRNDEKHLIADFQAGRDVGLGMFGGHGTSVFGLGVRFAQFQSGSNITLKSDPDWQFSPRYFYGLKVPVQFYHSNLAHLSATRSFHGLGPSLSWKASAPLVAGSHDSELTFDWGLNAAVLFGRQRAKVGHEETGRYHGPKYQKGTHVTVYHPTPVANADRVKTVTVPNIGGIVGATWRIQNFKLSAGYRADLFFGAMDGGIDAAKKENIGFYGPFATVSVGIGG